LNGNEKIKMFEIGYFDVVISISLTKRNASKSAPRSVASYLNPKLNLCWKERKKELPLHEPPLFLPTIGCFIISRCCVGDGHTHNAQAGTGSVGEGQKGGKTRAGAIRCLL
jgi:hypothetical protein